MAHQFKLLLKRISRLIPTIKPAPKGNTLRQFP